jgi:hypothetical protein
VLNLPNPHLVPATVRPVKSGEGDKSTPPRFFQVWQLIALLNFLLCQFDTDDRQQHKKE